MRRLLLATALQRSEVSRSETSTSTLRWHHAMRVVQKAGPHSRAGNCWQRISSISTSARNCAIPILFGGSRETASDSDGHLAETWIEAIAHAGSGERVQVITAPSCQVLRLQQVRCSTLQRRISTRCGEKVDMYVNCVVW